MSNTGNIHARAANNASSEDAPNAYALVEATLAVAYEQRTANLVALVAIASAEGWANNTEGQSLRVEALNRLGIEHKIGA